MPGADFLQGFIQVFAIYAKAPCWVSLDSIFAGQTRMLVQYSNSRQGYSTELPVPHAQGCVRHSVCHRSPEVGIKVVEEDFMEEVR